MTQRLQFDPASWVATQRAQAQPPSDAWLIERLTVAFGYDLEDAQRFVLPHDVALFVKVNGAWRFEGLESSRDFIPAREEIMRAAVEADNGPDTFRVFRLL